MMALNEEYKKRYNHKDDHIAIQKLGEVLKLPPIKFKNIFSAPTDIKPAMPDYCKIKVMQWHHIESITLWKREDLQLGNHLQLHLLGM